MVIKKEIKKDVFADFHVDDNDRIVSNAAQLEAAENSELNASSRYVDNDVFKDFDLDAIVRQNEELERQRMSDDNEISANSTKENSFSSARRFRQLVSSIRPKTKGEESSSEDLEAPTPSQKKRNAARSPSWIGPSRSVRQASSIIGSIRSTISGDSESEDKGRHNSDDHTVSDDSGATTTSSGTAFCWKLSGFLL